MTINPEIRRFFAEEIRSAGALRDGPETDRVIDAFAAVPREDHAGPGPWLLSSPLFGMASRRTPDANREHLYHNVLIALDEAQGVNIGEPSLWARFLSRTGIKPGTSILQVGAGSGYYSAILAEITGGKGHVLAFETDKALADMATTALAGRSNVTVRHGNGATDLGEGDGPFDLIVAFAGVTHPVQLWADLLNPAGRMLLPITSEKWWGAMVLAERNGDEFDAVSLGGCGFFPCAGARDVETANRVAELWSDRSRLDNKKIRIRLDGSGAHYQVDGKEY